MPTSLPGSFTSSVENRTPPAKHRNEAGDVDLGIACGVSGAGIFLTCLVFSAVAASVWGLLVALVLGGGLGLTAWRLAKPGWNK